MKTDRDSPLDVLSAWSPEKLWAVHILGPDDIYAAPSMTDAYEQAVRFQRFWDARPKRENSPIMTALVIEWAGSRENHASNVACYWPEFAQHPIETAAFQQRVAPWMHECFGETISNDLTERNHRFLEEALELVQSTGCTQSETHQLVDYVFGRPTGEPVQEVGGVMVTLAALCLAAKLDMQAAGETELARIWTKVDVIRAKQAAKPKHSPLPEHTTQPAAIRSAGLSITPKLRASAEFTREDLGDDGTNYPHVRTLLAYAEAAIKASDNAPTAAEPVSSAGLSDKQQEMQAAWTKQTCEAWHSGAGVTRELWRAAWQARAALNPTAAEVPQYTYASTQATNCAQCGQHKHTPLRIDAMDGYVCLTCIDKKLGGLLGEFGYPEDEAAAEVRREARIDVPFTVEFSRAFMDGAMEGEQREVLKNWKTVNDFIVSLQPSQDREAS